MATSGTNEKNVKLGQRGS